MATLRWLALLVTLAACAAPTSTTTTPPPAASLSALVDVSEQEVVVTRTRAGTDIRETYRWAVSTGRAGYRTPTGTFRPFFLSRDHRSSLFEDAPMPWSVFFNGDVAIHGTYEIDDLGAPVSHGCVRLHPTHAEFFFNQVQEVGMDNTVITVTP